MVDPRNDLLKAIRDGIKLRKVEKNEQKEVERGNGLHDVASILARRVAVEFSDSDSASESEYDSDGWGENETSAWHKAEAKGRVRKASVVSAVSQMY